MRDFLKKHTLGTLALIALLTALLVYSINLTSNDKANPVERSVAKGVAPVQAGATRSTNFFVRLFDDYLALVNVKRENERLVGEIKKLNTTVLVGNEALRENERLGKLLNLRKTVTAPTLAASIIGDDSTPWYRTLTLDRGSADGIREGMPVLAVDGIVGQTIKVTDHSCRVLLLTDHASSITAMVARSRARGVIKGDGDGRCSLEFTMRGEDVQVGDQIISSGVGGIFPKGLAIGQVTAVKKGDYGIFQGIAIKPAVSIAHLEEVLVVLRTHRD